MTPSPQVVGAGVVGLVLGALLMWVIRPAPDVAPPPLPEPTPPSVPMPPAKDLVRYTPVAFDDLPGWSEDSVADARPALGRSCAVWQNRPAAEPAGPSGIAGFAGDWAEACAALPDPSDPAALRTWLTTWFQPFAVEGPDGDTGIFTGYYEATLNGSFERTERYSVPLYGPPQDMIAVNLGQFDQDLAGKRVVGRVETRSLVPYDTRADIDGTGSLEDRAPVIIWVDDPVDAHILHIQGSGRVMLPDGSSVRVGYADNNGHRFTGIGGVLLRAGVLPRGQGSMPGVRQWLKDNPDAAAQYMNRNARYIFFRIIEGDGPLGAAGVALTPLRSLAVDTEVIPLNAPIWLDVDDPDGEQLERLMVAQDIGSAIKGIVRGDIFWGYGEAAFQKAGRMRGQGRYWLLLPKGHQGPARSTDQPQDS